MSAIVMTKDWVFFESNNEVKNQTTKLRNSKNPRILCIESLFWNGQCCKKYWKYRNVCILHKMGNL